MGIGLGREFLHFSVNVATVEAMTRAYSINDWVPVATCMWPHEAHVIRSMLQEHDITAVLADEHMAHGLGSIAIGGVRVMVALPDRERAECIIAIAAEQSSEDE